jgi:secreted Zn-dependent insulinase-like peptidase
VRYFVIKYLLVLFLSFYALTGFSSPSASVKKTITNETITIPKSPNDQRAYQALVLSNKLEVLLISDPSSDKASAALDVYVGSSDDPKEFLGLAHFLEHMLFLGTKKYPTPDEYQKFISDHGGSHNAFTSLEHTNYFFDIQADFLEEALDRFSQQFTSPLFNAEYVEREVNAVHSEYTSKIKDDSRRFFSAIKATLSDNHPYSKFSVGNLETLKDTPEKSLRDALLDFYDKHYSANKMRLVVLGKEPLAKLKNWVVEKFSDIPNKDIESFKIDQPFFDTGTLPAQLNVQTVMDKRSLTVAFPIPSDSPYKDAQPLNYIANLIGHEGKGSLLSKLKSMDLVDSLSAGSQFDTQTNTMLLVSMSLTQKGLDNYTLILNTLFDYIDLLKKQGIQKLYFDEQAQMLDIAFQYQEKSEPMHYTSSLAMALQETTPSKVLVENYKLTNFDAALYLEFIKQLTPSNMLIALSAKNVEAEKETLWYQAPYKLSKLDNTLLEELRDIKVYKDLYMPEANEFIPENTNLLKQANSKPEALKQTKGFDIWYAFDASFGTPKANIFLTLRSPISNSSADNENKTDILVSLLKDSLNEFSYPAYLAGLNFELYQHMRGITVKISGYSDKQSNLLIKIINSLKNVSFTEDRFAIIKERLKRQLDNAKDKKPFEQAIARAQNILINPSWTEAERLVALNELNLIDINSYRKQFLSELEAILFVNGNLSRASALNIAQQIDATLLKEARTTHVERAKITKLDGNNTWASAVNVKHSDTGYALYLQGKNNSTEEQAKLLLLNQVISTDFYGSIRTDKQLGYIVFSTSFTLLDVPGIVFIIQSPVAKGDTLLKESRLFLETQLSGISNISTENLDRYKSAVISKLLKQDNNLYSRSNRYWQDLDRENYEFDTNEDIAAAVSNISLDDLSKTLKELVMNNGRSLLVYTHQGEDELNYEEFGLSPVTDKTNSLFTTF